MWIVVKLLLTIGATILILVQMQPISFMAGIASVGPLTTTEHRGLQVQLIADAVFIIKSLFISLMTRFIRLNKSWSLHIVDHIYSALLTQRRMLDVGFCLINKGFHCL